MIKKIIEKLKKKKLFKYYYLEMHFTDGSSVNTDRIYYKSFENHVKKTLQGSELREPDDDDYLDFFNYIKYFCENINEANYFKVSIEKKDKTFIPDDIVEIIFHYEK